MLLLSCIFALPVHSESLTVATEGSYAPFSYIDEHGELAGFDVDIAHALCAEMKVACQVQAAPWESLIPGLEAGRFDMVVASMAHTDERALRVDFSDHYYRTHSVFASRSGRFTVTSPEALAGRRITTGRGTIQADFLQANYPASTLLLADDTAQALELLKQGEAELILSDTIHLLDFLESPEGRGFDYVGDPVASEMLKAEARIAVRKHNHALLARINEALTSLRLNGRYDQINRKHLPFSVY